MDTGIISLINVFVSNWKAKANILVREYPFEYDGKSNRMYTAVLSLFGNTTNQYVSGG